MYHIFTDHEDYYTHDQAEAWLVFSRMKENGNARLYELGDDEHEESLASVGNYPK